MAIPSILSSIGLALGASASTATAVGGTVAGLGALGVAGVGVGAANAIQNNEAKKAQSAAGIEAQADAQKKAATVDPLTQQELLQGNQNILGNYDVGTVNTSRGRLLNS